MDSVKSLHLLWLQIIIIIGLSDIKTATSSHLPSITCLQQTGKYWDDTLHICSSCSEICSRRRGTETICKKYCRATWQREYGSSQQSQLACGQPCQAPDMFCDANTRACQSCKHLCNPGRGMQQDCKANCPGEFSPLSGQVPQRKYHIIKIISHSKNCF